MNKIALMNPGQTALLVIDVQRALFTRPHPIYKAYQLLETINSLVDRSHLYGVQVFYVQHANQSFLAEGTDGWQIHPDLSPTAADKLIRKKKGNAFLETTLQGDCEARGIENILITGLVTDQCVRATSLGGVKLGYNVFLIKGAHSNFDADPEGVMKKHEAELEEAGVNVVSPEQIDYN